MLTVKIKSEHPIQLNHLQYKSKNSNSLSLESKNGKELAVAKLAEETNTLLVSIYPHLSLEQFQDVRNHLLRLNQLVNGQIDDSEALLGYLKTGEGAYIIHNWINWKRFLLESRFKTLEGQKVRVRDEMDRELGSGILASYQLIEENEDVLVKSCTLITSTGEKNFSTGCLLIEPTNEW